MLESNKLCLHTNTPTTSSPLPISQTPVFILFGPTASGKTALLEKLFNSPDVQIRGNNIKAEIISADSMQVYRGMNIGTAKPTTEEQAKLRYHLIDIRNPDEQFNAGEFVRLAEEACLAAAGRGALPVVSGGTGFYLKNLVLGLGEAPPSDLKIREALKAELEKKGAASLMEELAKTDPLSAERIHINDEYRLLRALEVCRLSGQPLSSYNSPWTPDSSLKKPLTQEQKVEARRHGEIQSSSQGAGTQEKFRFLLIGLRRTREELYNRINARTSLMFKQGLAEEVRRLYEAGYTPDDPGLRAIGYREFFIKDEASWHLSDDLAGVETLVAQNSRRYAKRQITFFTSIPDVKWVDCSGEEENTLEIKNLLEEFLM